MDELNRLRAGTAEWNAWRSEHRSEYVHLVNEDLSGLSLSGADLQRTNLAGARLNGTDLSGAVLAVTDLSRADLTGANLANASLVGADLTGASLSGAFLVGTEFLHCIVAPDDTIEGLGLDPEEWCIVHTELEGEAIGVLRRPWARHYEGAPKDHPLRPPDTGRLLDERRRQAAASLLRCLSQEELAVVAMEIGIEPPINRGTVAHHLGQRPRFEMLATVLRSAEPTILMLRGILGFLERHGCAARTTGCALVLADPVRPSGTISVELSPQAAGVICTWESRTLRRLGAHPFQNASNSWKAMGPGWRNLCSDAEPVTRGRRIDAYKTVMNFHRGIDRNAYEPPQDWTDYRAQAVLAYLLLRVHKMATSLQRAPRGARTQPHDRLLLEMQALLGDCARDIFVSDDHSPGPPLVPRPRRSWQEPSPAELSRYAPRPFLDDLDRLCEDLLCLGDQLEGERLFDLLRVDLWTTRPQLYEVWLLTAVLDWIESRGWRVELQKITHRAGAGPVWALAYAKDTRPCARVFGPDGDGREIFYQLYRPSGDMPDLCMLHGRSPVWSLDAKHSEAGGYSLSDYRRTAERYRDSFGAPLSLVAEYFPRLDLRIPNPFAFGQGAALILDARPGGEGAAMLFDTLADSHPRARGTLVCVDLSSSFASSLDAALRRICAMLKARGTEVLDQLVCFAGSAEITTGMRGYIDTAGVPDLKGRLDLAEGTRMGPLLDAISTLR